MKVFIEARINELHWGQFVVGKAQFLINTTILLKVFDVQIEIILISIPVVFGVILFIGRLFDKYFRKGYLKAFFKDHKF